jgi:hypothetical protein
MRWCRSDLHLHLQIPHPHPDIQSHLFPDSSDQKLNYHQEAEDHPPLYSTLQVVCYHRTMVAPVVHYNIVVVVRRKLNMGHPLTFPEDILHSCALHIRLGIFLCRCSCSIYQFHHHPTFHGEYIVHHH